MKSTKLLIILFIYLDAHYKFENLKPNSVQPSRYYTSIVYTLLYGIVMRDANNHRYYIINSVRSNEKNNQNGTCTII